MYFTGANIHSGEFKVINQIIQNGEFAILFCSESIKVEIII